MKKSVFFAAIAAFVLAACSKSPVDVPAPAPVLERVSAVMDEPLTKSDYTISGSTASFEWTAGDGFFRLVRKFTEEGGVRTYSNYDHYSYDIDAIDGANATFTGSPVGDTYEDSGFALYPYDRAPFNANNAWFKHSQSGTALTFTFSESLAYDAANPLKGIVPMVGKYDGTQYVFKPILGVIGISATNIPAEATSISISSTSGGLSGTSVTMTGVTDESYKTNINNLVGPTSEGLKLQWFTAGTSKTFTFSGLASDQTYTFYYPVPVGTYSDLTITLKAGDDAIAVVSASGLSLAVSRAKISNIPAVIDFSKSNYAEVALTGNASAFSAYVSSKSASVKSVKVAVANTAEAALASASSGTKVISAAGEANAVSVSDGLSVTGQYYLGYVACGASGNELLSGSFPVYYIGAADASARMGTYKMAYNAGLYPTSLPDNGDDCLTFEVSDDPSKGNVMLTKAFGFCWDVSQSTHTSLVAYDFSTFSSGSPIYGFYNPAASNPQMVFSNISDQVFYYDAGGHPHFICEYGTNTLRFGFDSNAYNSTMYDLICWGGYIMNCYDNTSSYDLYISKFSANKQ